MTTAFKEKVNNYTSAYNSYSQGQRNKMYEDTVKQIGLIEKEITKTYRDQESIKYPFRYSNISEKQIAGESKKMSSLQFVMSLSSNINAGHSSSAFLLLEEIKKSINTDDRDSATSMIESADALLQASDKISPTINSKFKNEFEALKKSYYEKIGIEDISGTIKDLESRKAEMEFILYAIEKKDEFIILPRDFEEKYGGIDLVTDAKARQVMLALRQADLEYVNRSMQFLAKKQVKLKN